MNPTGSMAARVFTFGRCRRCTRISALAAVGAWAMALMAFAVLGPSVPTYGTVALALALSALWVAHRMRSNQPGTLRVLLRALGAEPNEARAIAAALVPVLGIGAHGALPQGLTLNLTRAPRSARAGFTVARVVVRTGEGVVACLVPAQRGAFRLVDADQ